MSTAYDNCRKFLDTHFGQDYYTDDIEVVCEGCPDTVAELWFTDPTHMHIKIVYTNGYPDKIVPADGMSVAGEPWQKG